MALVDDMRNMTYESRNEKDLFKLILNQIKRQALIGNFKLEIESALITTEIKNALEKAGFFIDRFFKCIRNNRTYPIDYNVNKDTVLTLEQEGIIKEDLIPSYRIMWH